MTLVRMAERMGKSAILDRVLPTLNEEYIVLSDTRQTWSKESLEELLGNFSDPTVGAVSGELILGKGGGEFEKGLGFYWNYEKFLRKHEASFDSTCGVKGCIYAIRRSLFQTIPDDTLLDDFVIPMNITKNGYRVVFEERALAFDRIEEEPKKEWRRKIRTLSGNYQAFFRMPWIFHPLLDRIFLQVLSHKVLRIAAPFFLITLFFANAALLQHSIYKAMFAAQATFYGLALLSFLIDIKTLGPIKVFVFLNAAAFISLPMYWMKKQKAAWK